MKKLFLRQLKKYTRTEDGRDKIFSILHEQIEREYNEQTNFGNVYNGFIEFLMSNEFIIYLVKSKDVESLKTIISGLNKSFLEGIKFIEKEK